MALKRFLSLLMTLSMVLNQLRIITSHTTATSSVNSVPKQISIISHLRNSKLPLSQSEKPLENDPWSSDSYFGLQNDAPLEARELINLGSYTPGVSPCASILTTSNCVLQLADDPTHKIIQERQFVLATGLIKEQCSLTVRDCSGSYTTFTNYLFLPGSACNTAASVCCECNGCNRPNFRLYENSCAILFEHEKCSLCNGFRLEVANGDKIENMNPFVDNKVSSIYVVPGCELTIFQDPSFQGYAALARGSLDYLPFVWNDIISSYKCHCHADILNSTTTTVYSTTPQSSTKNHEQGHSTLTTAAMPETTTALMKIASSTIGSEDTRTTTTMHVTSTEKMQTIITAQTTELTTLFDDSNYVY